MKISTLLVLFSFFLTIFSKTYVGEDTYEYPLFGEADFADEEIPQEIRESQQNMNINMQTLPMMIMPNGGQTDSRVEYLVKILGSGNIFFTKEDIVWSINNSVMRLTYPEGNLHDLDHGEELEGKVNFMIGNDRDNWVIGLPTYEHIAYNEVWKGIQLRHKIQDGSFVSEWHVERGRDYKKIKIEVDEWKDLQLDDNGQLLYKNTTGNVFLIEKPPMFIQGETRLNGNYQIQDNIITFKINDPKFVPKKKLIITG
ncbi:cell surface glycoprotein (s-layer protein)-like protein [Anaeramoeba flamelloides]|uniref:Cell surface glycoprotein (S-layer protein)-like protein n=1 Tax=Anaeramoeba flamelloides TaxID=1746091 RepID=A0ABQ8XCX9_9EUKA|nr:cell surface glycoprotein (s-layer protein)-like protein [Anaeramoeba flamelloides]